jgi:hypothetical protein
MLTFKNFLLLIFIIGIVIVTQEVTKMTYKCPKKETEYKYIPRSLDIDIKDSADVDKIFKRMFNTAEPWIGASRADSNKFRKIKKKNYDLSDEYKKKLIEQKLLN